MTQKYVFWRNKQTLMRVGVESIAVCGQHIANGYAAW
jgi:hypothetical protein